MIVSGGSNGSIYLNNGGKDDPTTDSGLPTGTTNTAVARGSHTVV